jgi:hypothetical protein
MKEMLQTNDDKTTRLFNSVCPMFNKPSEEEK